MKRMKVFLGGPIQYILDSDGSFPHEPRKTIQSIVDILSLRHMEVFSAHIHEQFGTVVPSNMEICCRDYAWMKKCDLYCLLMLSNRDGLIRSDGACIELGWASSMNKPIVIIVDQSVFHNTSSLVQGLAEVFRVKIVSLDAVMQHPNQLIQTINQIMFEEKV